MKERETKLWAILNTGFRYYMLNIRVPVSEKNLYIKMLPAFVIALQILTIIIEETLIKRACIIRVFASPRFYVIVTKCFRRNDRNCCTCPKSCARIFWLNRTCTVPCSFSSVLHVHSERFPSYAFSLYAEVLQIVTLEYGERYPYNLTCIYTGCYRKSFTTFKEYIHL
jgi:hypothetical protein